MPPKRTTPNESKSGLRHPLVLVVEDDAALADMMKEALAAERVRVLLAPDGGAAIRWLKQVTPDLVIVDLALPVLDGESLIAHVRHGPEPHPGLIVCSAVPDAQMIASRLGVRHVLEKPFLTEDLVRTAMRAIEDAQAETLRSGRKKWTRPPILPGTK